MQIDKYLTAIFHQRYVKSIASNRENLSDCTKTLSNESIDKNLQEIIKNQLHGKIFK